MSIETNQTSEIKIELSIESRIKLNHISMTFKGNEKSPYLHSVYIGDVWQGKDSGAYNQLQDLIDDISKIQETFK